MQTIAPAVTDHSEDAPDLLDATEARPVLRRLLDKLEARGVRYCHWKSNFDLAAALGGADDLDLLVDPQCANAFQRAMLEEGFKPATSRTGAAHPGVFHAVGLDEQRLELVHLHVYFQIVSGDSLVKSYRFAVESALLDNGRRLHGVRVPAAEAELTLLLLRLALKYVHPVEIAMACRDAPKAAREVRWLMQDAAPDAAARFRARWFPEIDARLIGQLGAAFADERTPLLTRMILGRRVASRLARRRRLGSYRAMVMRSRRVGTLLLGRLSHRRDLVLQTGGHIIAIVGPKATGKSTLAAEIATRLGRYLDVSPIHAGKPPPTFLTAGLRCLLPLARRVLPGERPSRYEQKERREANRYSLLYCLRMLMLAHDRLVLLGWALRRSTGGAIVISDRYPCGVTGMADSSCFSDAAVASAGPRVKRWMMERERAAYVAMPAPDLVIRLVAPIETTILRDATRVKEGGPDAASLARRWDKENGTAFAARVVDIRTDRSLDETVSAVLKSIWASI
jgi:hypothetical protein